VLKASQLRWPYGGSFGDCPNLIDLRYSIISSIWLLKLRWNMVGSTGRITQSPDKSSNFEQGGKVMHLHI
jgi:hypothetical protein